MNLTITLTLEQINIVLTALAQGPFNQVANVINAVETQAKAQLPTENMAKTEKVEEQGLPIV